MDQEVIPLYQLIQKLVSHHRQMLDCVRAEKTALVNADLKAIQETSCFKEGLIEQIRQVEAERTRFVSHLASRWNQAEAELTLQRIIHVVQGRDVKAADQLRNAFSALSHLIQRIREQNADNQSLLQRSIEHLQNMKRNVLGEANPNHGTYTQSGQKTAPGTGARFVSREA